MFSDLVRTPDIGPLIVDTVPMSGVWSSISFSSWFGRDCEPMINARAKGNEARLINFCFAIEIKLHAN